LDETFVAFDNPVDQLEKGIELCRKGDWKSGFEHLNAVAGMQKEPGKLPGRYYSYLGYGMAVRQKRIEEGIKLCRYGIKVEFFHPENYANLARTYVLAGRRAAAAKTLAKGLEIDAKNPDLLKLQETMGARKPPVLSFLSRNNFLNKILGRIRHSNVAAKEKAKKEKAAKARAAKARAKAVQSKAKKSPGRGAQRR
jgi:hypothetical protein